MKATYQAGTLVYSRKGLLILSFWLLFWDFAFNFFEAIFGRFLPIYLKDLQASNTVIGLMPEALAIDPSNGDILISLRQHCNNRQALLLDPKGWLTRFTGTNGNIKITWIGRVDPVSGMLKNSTYIYVQMPASKNPKWPDLNSVGTSAIGADSKGWVYAVGGTTISLPTTSNAFLPSVTQYGGHPFFAVIEPDLSAPRYSTYLSPGQGGVSGMVVCGYRVAFLVGTHKTDAPALPTQGTDRLPALSATPPDGEAEAAFLAIVPVPAEVDSWSFKN